MDSNEFRKRGTEMVEYIWQFLETFEDRQVTSYIEPGYLRPLFSGEEPMKPEPCEKVMEDVETKIMPGVTHWQYPRFHAFLSENSYRLVLGDMLGDAIGCIGFLWVI
jgi:tyrosine decarboxylase